MALIFALMAEPVWATGLGGIGPGYTARNAMEAYCLNHGGTPSGGYCYFPDAIAIFSPSITELVLGRDTMRMPSGCQKPIDSFTGTKDITRLIHHTLLRTMS